MREYRSNVGYVQQDPYGALPPFMNVQTILEEPMIINGIKDKKNGGTAFTGRLKKLR
jgi:peptide/nickel transport system ATP-binding protein